MSAQIVEALKHDRFDKEGHEAGRNGLPSTACPYSEGSEAWTSWSYSWCYYPGLRALPAPPGRYVAGRV